MHKLGSALSGLIMVAHVATSQLHLTATSREDARSETSRIDGVARMETLSGDICRSIAEIIGEQVALRNELRAHPQDSETIRFVIRSVERALRDRKAALADQLKTLNETLSHEGGPRLMTDPGYRRAFGEARGCLRR